MTAFRRSLRDCAVEMERASGPDEIRLLQQHFRERIADEGLEDLRQKLSAWKRQSMQDTALLALPSVLGAYRNHRKITRHPSWFLFRISESNHLRR